MRIKTASPVGEFSKMNDFWDRMKRELRDAIREPGRPDLMLAIFSGVTAWALTSVLRLAVTVLQSKALR